MLDLTPVAAEIFLISAICVVLIVDVFLKKEQRDLLELQLTMLFRISEILLLWYIKET